MKSSGARQWWRTGPASVVMGALVAVLVTAGPAGAIPPGDPGDPDAPTRPGVQCLERTRVSTSVDKHVTFGESVRYSWNIDPGCSGLVFTVNGQQVGLTGSMQVSVPTSRNLSVRGSLFGTGSGEWGRQFVLAGRFVNYVESSNGGLVARSEASSGNTIRDAMAKEVMEAVKPQYLSGFDGRMLEIHQIPPDRKLTDLRPWSHLDPDERTDNAADGDRTWSDMRGIALYTSGTTAAAVAMGEERNAHTVAHELGHVVLSVGASELIEDADQLRAIQVLAPIFGSDSEPVGCDDDYVLSNVDEYWAEATAALFNTQEACSPPPSFSTEYTPAFLKAANEPLYDLVRRVYDAG